MTYLVNAMAMSSESFWHEFFDGTGSFRQLSIEIDRAMERSTPRSHALGFFRLKIGSLNGGPIYLHIWLPEYVVQQSQELLIHSHSVTIKSYILLGGFCDERYSWVDSPSGRHRLFAQNRDNIGPKLLKTERIGTIQYNRTLELCDGTMYKIPFPEFHRIIANPNQVSVTIALFDGVSSASPFVVAPISTESVQDYIPVDMDAEHKKKVQSLITKKFQKLTDRTLISMRVMD